MARRGALELTDFKNTRSQIKARESLEDSDIIEERKGSDKQVNEGFYYYDRESERMDICSINDKAPYWMHWEEADLFENWKKQIDDTIAAAAMYPFQYIPMYTMNPGAGC